MLRCRKPWSLDYVGARPEFADVCWASRICAYTCRAPAMSSNAAGCATPGHAVPAYIDAANDVGPKVIVPRPSDRSLRVTSVSVRRSSDLIDAPDRMMI